MIRLAIAGAAGRMGQRIAALASHDDRFQVSLALDADSHPDLGRDVGELAGVGRLGPAVQPFSSVGNDSEFDVLIDFSLPAGTMAALSVCLSARRPIVIGTTGHDETQLADIHRAAETIPLLKAPNMSVGVNVLFRIAGQVAAALGEDYDCEIIESHHRFKADAPSGTAVELLNRICQSTGRDPGKDAVYGRQGQTGQRPAGQIGVLALRVGDTVGEHDVHFGCLGETVVLRHVAHTRDTFVRGALRAAVWVAEKPVGFYTMQDVLFG
ncbi:MAG: 4-hydroxy-tetrahydrodipicolinate reductase [Phycisphaerae bacterium]|nr:4-hydroxy-tetrahydrodipicolinate reductase [Phycisphaerae bacterium]